MDIRTACEVLRQLLDGIDPETGEVTPEEHLVREDTVRQALLMALQAMGARPASGQVLTTRSGRLNAGRPWTREDLADLRSMYESGVSIDEIAQLTHRRARGIRLQLNLMAGGGARRSERVEIPDRFPAAGGEPSQKSGRPANSHQPWSPEQDAHLIQLHAEGWNTKEIANTFARSANAIEARLKKLGLTEADGLEENDPSRPWTEKDTLTLSRLAAQGHRPEVIAEQMQRTQAAVKARMFYMGEDVAAPEVIPQSEHESDAAHPSGGMALSPAATSSRRWTQEEDAYLQSAWQAGVSVDDMAKTLGRRERLVRCRLIYLDIADRGELGECAAPPELAHQGLPWYPEEITMLQHLFRQGESCENMAAQLKRSAEVIRNRLTLLGLVESTTE